MDWGDVHEPHEESDVSAVMDGYVAVSWLTQLAHDSTVDPGKVGSALDGLLARRPDRSPSDAPARRYGAGIALIRYKDLCIDAADPDEVGRLWAAALGLRLGTDKGTVCLDGPVPATGCG